MDPPPSPLPEVNTASPPPSEAAPPPSAAASAPAVQPKTPANHPPYSVMILSAIRILGDQQGWSKTVIKKAISSAYTNLPPAHSALVSRHLKRLKKRGAVVMVKHSYMLPGAPRVHLVKRGPGRPRKGAIKTSAVGVGGGVKRGRGRPRKVAGTVGVDVGLGSVKRGRGRPRKEAEPISTPIPNPQPNGIGSVKRGRGRPLKQIWSKLIPISNSNSEPAPIGSVKRGRGRPRKETGPESIINESPRVRKGPGRPRKETEPKPVYDGPPQVKRGPGRPRKQWPTPVEAVPNVDAVVEDGGVPVDAAVEDGGVLNMDAVVEDGGVPTPTTSIGGASGRKRGRPRKYFDMSPRMVLENGVVRPMGVPRGRGRPRKSGSGGSDKIVKSLSSGRPVGRPKKGGILVPTIVPVGDI